MNVTARWLAEMRARWADRAPVPDPDWEPPLPEWTRSEPSKWSGARALWTHGEVWWGRMLMANSTVFAPGDEDAPGLAIWSADPFVQATPHWLDRVKQRFWALKRGTTDDDTPLRADTPGIRALLELARDELSRPQRQRLPHLLAAERVVYLETVMIIRRHLPGEVLSSQHLPLVLDRQCEVLRVYVLPARFWPKGFIEQVWSD